MAFNPSDQIWYFMGMGSQVSKVEAIFLEKKGLLRARIRWRHHPRTDTWSERTVNLDSLEKRNTDATGSRELGPN